MEQVKLMSPVATVIGDVVGSRSASDRGQLHERLSVALTTLNEAAAPLVPLRVTVGDEFQGCFEHLGEAIAASLRLRLMLLPEVDLRMGLGWGPVTVLAGSPRVEDGPGWWSAREAIEAVSTEARKAAFRLARTGYRRAADTAGADEAAVNASLRLRDQLVGSLSERSLGVLGDLLDNKPQVDIARDLGVSASAVSQRVRGDGLAMMVAAESSLGGIR